jgi:hypothetical protein
MQQQRSDSEVNQRMAYVLGKLDATDVDLLSLRSEIRLHGQVVRQELRFYYVCRVWHVSRLSLSVQKENGSIMVQGARKYAVCLWQTFQADMVSGVCMTGLWE